VDFFTVPTIRFQVLYVFLVLAHERRRILHFNVTAHPTAEWTAQQLRNAFPWDSAPRYLLRDGDRISGDNFTRQVHEMGVEQVLCAPRSPWHRAYIERVIGTIRRECLDRVIMFNEAALYRYVKTFTAYYHGCRTHLSTGQGLAGAASRLVARSRTNRCYPASGRPPSPLRTAGNLKTVVAVIVPAEEVRRYRRFLALESPIATDNRAVNPVSLGCWQTLGDFVSSLLAFEGISAGAEFPTGTIKTKAQS
jgi:transposase InsO family protein